MRNSLDDSWSEQPRLQVINLVSGSLSPTNAAVSLCNGDGDDTDDAAAGAGAGAGAAPRPLPLKFLSLDRDYVSCR